jgi:hypothetical protein
MYRDVVDQYEVPTMYQTCDDKKPRISFFVSPEDVEETLYICLAVLII